LQKDVFDRLRHRPRRRRGLAPRMAPMIDMVFLLLIFFLVSSQWRPQEDFLPLNLAAAQAGETSIGRPEPLEVRISSTPTGCLVRIGQAEPTPIDDATFAQDLTLLTDRLDNRLRAENRFTDDPIEIICNGDVKWDHLTRIYNVLYGAGLTDITFRMTE